MGMGVTIHGLPVSVRQLTEVWPSETCWGTKVTQVHKYWSIAENCIKSNWFELYNVVHPPRPTWFLEFTAKLVWPRLQLPLDSDWSIWVNFFLVCPVEINRNHIFWHLGPKYLQCLQYFPPLQLPACIPEKWDTWRLCLRWSGLQVTSWIPGTRRTSEPYWWVMMNCFFCHVEIVFRRDRQWGSARKSATVM